jgi:transcriptional regulator with XRE-family HTH domain
MTLGDRMAAKREEKGWSQRELARQSGVPHTVISELERNVREVATSDVVKKLARTLGVSADYLIGTWDEDAEIATRRRRNINVT